MEQGFEKVPRLQRGSERSLVILAFVLDQKGGRSVANPDLIALGKGVDLSNCVSYLQNLASDASLLSLELAGNVAPGRAPA